MTAIANNLEALINLNGSLEAHFLHLNKILLFWREFEQNNMLCNKFEPLLRIRIFKILQNNLSSTSEGWIQFKNFELNKNLCNKADEKEVLDIDDSGTKLEIRGEPKIT